MMFLIGDRDRYIGEHLIFKHVLVLNNLTFICLIARKLLDKNNYMGYEVSRKHTWKALFLKTVSIWVTPPDDEVVPRNT